MQTEPENLPLKAALQQAKGWDAVMRELMLASLSLAVLADSERTEDKLLAGCESQVWLDVTISHDRVTLRAFSPSKVIRGLLTVMFEPLQGQPVALVCGFDMEDYLEQLGLARHLSPSRGNGLKAVMTAIKKSLTCA
ncbi:SufE family protein [Aliiglaciecola sp. CAU 1673]|uniref:SufE family protein n=1 Tax=Aliiglaciecola sp. CAU 1673 TaxID=3032595 RepID=UPI0023DB71AD|nr:SufE family protein [Aliiglaciecola sp. CAU 1673]MDF2177087.1 SufE family protein [Aliiglaciecola sp. CAU 1673]